MNPVPPLTPKASTTSGKVGERHPVLSLRSDESMQYKHLQNPTSIVTDMNLKCWRVCNMHGGVVGMSSSLVMH